MILSRTVPAVAALLAGLPSGEAFAQSGQRVPSPETIVGMARDIEFTITAVTDDPVPAEVRQLNPKFGIKVYYRTGDYTVQFRPSVGAIFAKVVIKGVPKERGLPDGEYYLWIGGPADSLSAALGSVDGKFVKGVDVETKPSVLEEGIPHSPKVHSLIEDLPPSDNSRQTPGARQQPKPQPPKPPPTKPPPPKEPPQRRSWREICVTPRPVDHGQGGGKRWVRVPDN